MTHQLVKVGGLQGNVPEFKIICKELFFYCQFLLYCCRSAVFYRRIGCCLFAAGSNFLNLTSLFHLFPELLLQLLLSQFPLIRGITLNSWGICISRTAWLLLIFCHSGSLCVSGLTSWCRFTLLSPSWVLPFQTAVVPCFLYFRLIVLSFSFHQI